MGKNRTIIFDLDNTLVDVEWRFMQCVERVTAFLEKRLGQALTIRARRIIKKTPWISMHRLCEELIPEDTARREQLIEEAVQYYHRIPLSTDDMKRIRFMPYTKNVLAYLRKEKIRILVVSFGNPIPQKKKLKILGENYFDATYVGQKEKGKTFASLVRKHALDPMHTVVLGDKKNSEIMAGNHLGFTTIHFAFGRHSRCPIQDPLEQPDFTVYNMKDLLPLLRRLFKH